MIQNNLYYYASCINIVIGHFPVGTAGTGFFYVTTKNPRNVAHKLSLKKYDPVVRKHVIFSESKLK